MSLVDLAIAVIDMLDGQKRYFRSRSQADLIASKQAEAKLRKVCQEILQQPDEGAV